MPLISVIMSVHNGEVYLPLAIESILNQTCNDFEFLIIDDGSTDSSYRIIKSYGDRRIQSIKQENTGLSKALNRGLSEAKGKYIARMDADDVSHPTRFEKELKAFEENPDIVLTGTNANVIDEHGEHIHITNLPLSWQEIRKVIRFNPFVHSSVMYRRDIALKAGGYYEKIKHYFEDVILWNRMSEYGQLVNIKDTLVDYRVSPGAITIKSKKDRYTQKLIDKIIAGSDLEIDEIERFLQRKQKISTNNRVYYYHLYLSKKLLWNSHNPERAREHIFKSIKTVPYMPEPYFLSLFSLLPAGLIQTIYNIRKA